MTSRTRKQSFNRYAPSNITASRREAAQIEQFQQKVEFAKNERNRSLADQEANRLMMQQQESERETQALLNVLHTQVLEERMSLVDFYRLELQVEQARTTRWKALRGTAAKLIKMKHYGKQLACFLGANAGKARQQLRASLERNAQYDQLLALEKENEKEYVRAKRTCPVDLAYREFLSSTGATRGKQSSKAQKAAELFSTVGTFFS